MRSVNTALVVGAGPVGCTVAMGLARQGWSVQLLERRSHQACVSEEGQGRRTLSLSLSPRGREVLHKLGVDAALQEVAVRMGHRVVHAPDGTRHEAAYGPPEWANLAVDRAGLTKILLRAARDAGVEVNFDSSATDVDATTGTVTTPRGTLEADLVVAADGASSRLRRVFLDVAGVSYRQAFHGWGHIEVPMPDLAAPPRHDAIHIVRGSRFVVALPHRDGRFRATLVLPFEGADSFASLRHVDQLVSTLSRSLPQARFNPTELERAWVERRPGWFTTVAISQLHLGRIAFVGDAGHAICPFMGQGINLGLQGADTLLEALSTPDSVAEGLAHYSTQQVPEAAAASSLSEANWHELCPTPDPSPSAAPPLHGHPVTLTNFSGLPYAQIHAGLLAAAQET